VRPRAQAAQPVADRAFRLEQQRQRYMDPARFVFLDETGITTKMTRLYGRASPGERLVSTVPHGHWRLTTFIAGLCQSEVVAPLVLDGAMTGAAFRAYAEQAPAPVLKPGDASGGQPPAGARPITASSSTD